VLPDPLHGQPLIRVPAEPAQVRVLLDRSRESALAGEPTQDYLAVRVDRSRLSFAVTDGVGSSFLGDVAAQILAAHVAEWLAPQPTTDSDRLASAFTAFLHELSQEMAERVAAWPLPAGVSAIVQTALDQQRAYGSEAMVACGVVDLSGGRAATAAIAWLGDARLRVITRDGRQSDHYGQTSDRWSSRLGPRGAAGCRIWPASEVVRIIACTDGLLPELDSTVELPDDQLRQRLHSLAQRPGNDDMALIDVGLTVKAMPGVDATSPQRRREPTHARTTVAGTALRRLVRAVTPPPLPAPPPAPQSPPPAAGPAAGPVAPTRPMPAPVAASAAVPDGTGPDAPRAVAPGPPATGRASVPPAARNPAGPAVAQDVRLADVPPPDGVRSDDRELSWSPVPAADSYAVEVCSDADFASPLLYAVRGTTFAVPPIGPAVFVRLRSIVDDKPGPWGNILDLSTQDSQ
jgi:protein phosphatase 2C-like protein